MAEHHKRFLLVGIQPHSVSDAEQFNTFKELWRLVESYGGEIIDVLVQHREVHDKGGYLGAGKTEEVAHRIKPDHIDVIVLNDILKPGHLYELQHRFTKEKPEVEVWDRVDLILQIFSKHAHTAEARLQIELASMRHMGPRIYGLGSEMSRQGGGIGSRGIGETNTERMKRHWAAQMKKVQLELKKMSQDRERQLDRRRRVGLQTVSLIGYTNAGKTSLYNQLVGKQKFVDNLLFATLDASVGKIFLPELQRHILVSDTIGFIQGLPPELVQAFRSTLIESVYADLLLHVIDISDQQMTKQIQTVDDILRDLGLIDRPRIFIFNKIDRWQGDQQSLANKYAHFHPQFISVVTDQGITEIASTIANQLNSFNPE